MFCIILGFIFGRKGEKWDGLPHRRARRCAMTFFESAAGGSSGTPTPTGAWLLVRCIRDDVGIVPYGVGKTPVGRGQCAPPLGVRRLSGGGTHGCRPTEKFAKHA